MMIKALAISAMSLVLTACAQFPICPEIKLAMCPAQAVAGGK